ncbi:MAG: hypothetical protein R3346_00845 [Candidatus Spechtbacterales bacterium]|nr:hypothetical protein [Candidatus Spechtbacterales bacterium]
MPEITERTVEGERQVTFSSDGTRLSVQTTEDRHFVDVYPESFFGSQNTTSVLRVHLGDGKEVEVPVNIGIMQSLTRQTPDTAEGQALLELDPDATHQYVLRVNQIQNRMLFSERFVRIFTGIGDESMVPFGSLRGMDQTLNDVPSEIAWYHNLILDHAVLAKYNELVDQDELGEDIRKYCEVDIHRSTNWCEPSDNDSGALTERIFDLSDEARNFVEEASFADQKQYLSEEDVQKMEQLQVLDEMSEEELLQALGETVVFVAPVELVSIDGINISSN